MVNNPLLEFHQLPRFDAIQPEHMKPAIEQLIEQNRKAIDKITQQSEPPTWDNTEAPLEEMDDRLGQAWSPIGHLNGVMNTPEIREAYNQCLPLLSAYSTEVGQNQALYQRIKALQDSDEYNTLTTAQKKIVDNQVRDFHLSGVDLPEDKKKRFADIKQRRSELSSKFTENVMDATQAWHKHITDESHLKGLPESALASARAAAEEKELEGYVFTLDIPSYLALITYAEDRELRREAYEAFTTRASDKGPVAGEYDNSEIMQETLALRHESSQLLGFNNYAEASLATKMAETPEQVIDFLNQLARKSKPQAERELIELRTFAKDELGIDDMHSWDVMFTAEKLKHAKYAVSQEELRPYFPAPKVIQGMFDVVHKLFGVKFTEREDVPTWHEDVTYYELVDEDNGDILAAFYLDPYARSGKRGGAWMDDCRVRRKLGDGALQKPVAYLVCNFTPPVDNKPSLLTHDEVTTLFHEFGHGLHHMLTKIDYAGVSGIHGVAWDAVELPSQFLENWCWHPDAIALISGHHETGDPLPKELLDKLLAAKNFQSAMMMVRQLEFSLFDMRIHMEFTPEQSFDIQAILDDVRDHVSVMKPPAFNRFQHSFNHIFGGGYAAGYYSYKWAEVLSADAFSKFEEEGVFNTKTGHLFRSTVLENGGSQEALDLFKAFRGREPSNDPLLKHTGIQTG